MRHAPTTRDRWLPVALLAAALAGCSGADGKDGDRGEQGTQGPAGLPGEDGQDGADGAQGAPGKAAEAPLIVPPTDVGTYTELSQKWWAWAYSIPAASHPLGVGTDCTAGQAGPVWFLGGAFESASVTRQCTVPKGKAIFFPIVNVGYSNIGEDPLKTDAELHELAAFYGSAATGMSAAIDGNAVSNIDDYHVHSGVFWFSYPDAPGPDDSLSAGSSTMVTDGYYLMTNPLPAGDHTIEFKGKLVFTEAIHGFDLTFDIDVKYELTIQ
jgi:hypothetical protein